MTVSEKIKAINNKIAQNKAQHDLDKLLKFWLHCQEALANMNFLLEKDLLEKTATIKRFEYFPLGSEMK